MTGSAAEGAGRGVDEEEEAEGSGGSGAEGRVRRVERGEGLRDE